ncbi:hypothetical protein BD410DRAFT_838830 [Rickenella mellea]|uniref:Uncharacterized protein n=1 Tax=Rickenella mellea TaxID=50990 RepID=A0A4Y7Q9Q9_9AGAM|nr:hypothetical protein BD410DRAFT_838830 [Rickenella mellea]
MPELSDSPLQIPEAQIPSLLHSSPSRRDRERRVRGPRERRQPSLAGEPSLRHARSTPDLISMSAIASAPTLAPTPVSPLDTLSMQDLPTPPPPYSPTPVHPSVCIPARSPLRAASQPRPSGSPSPTTPQNALSPPTRQYGRSISTPASASTSKSPSPSSTPTSSRPTYAPPPTTFVTTTSLSSNASVSSCMTSSSTSGSGYGMPVRRISRSSSHRSTSTPPLSLSMAHLSALNNASSTPPRSPGLSALSPTPLYSSPSITTTTSTAAFSPTSPFSPHSLAHVHALTHSPSSPTASALDMKRLLSKPAGPSSSRSGPSSAGPSDSEASTDRRERERERREKEREKRRKAREEAQARASPSPSPSPSPMSSPYATIPSKPRDAPLPPIPSPSPTLPLSPQPPIPPPAHSHVNSNVKGVAKGKEKARDKDISKVKKRTDKGKDRAKADADASLPTGLTPAGAVALAYKQQQQRRSILEMRAGVLEVGGGVLASGNVGPGMGLSDDGATPSVPVFATPPASAEDGGEEWDGAEYIDPDLVNEDADDARALPSIHERRIDAPRRDLRVSIDGLERLMPTDAISNAGSASGSHTGSGDTQLPIDGSTYAQTDTPPHAYASSSQANRTTQANINPYASPLSAGGAMPASEWFADVPADKELPPIVGWRKGASMGVVKGRKENARDRSATMARIETEPSPTSRLWRLVKRISSGALRDSPPSSSSPADAPPVPAIPRELLHQHQLPSPPSTVEGTTTGAGLMAGGGRAGAGKDQRDTVRARFMHSRPSLSILRALSPVPGARATTPMPSSGSPTVHMFGRETMRSASADEATSFSPSVTASSTFPPPSARSSASSYGGDSMMLGGGAALYQSPASTPTKGATSSSSSNFVPFIGRHILPPAELHALERRVEDGRLDDDEYDLRVDVLERDDTALRLRERGLPPSLSHAHRGGPSSSLPLTPEPPVSPVLQVSLPFPPRRTGPPLVTHIQAATASNTINLTNSPGTTPSPTSPLIPVFSTAHPVNTFGPAAAKAAKAAAGRSDLVSSSSSPFARALGETIRDADEWGAGVQAEMGLTVAKHTRGAERGSVGSLSNASTARPWRRSSFGSGIGSGTSSSASGLSDGAGIDARMSLGASPFRDLKDVETRPVVSEAEKAAKWDALLAKSARAGGTLRVGGGGALLSDRLPDDDFSVS